MMVMMMMTSGSWESCSYLLRKIHLSGLVRICVASVWTKTPTRMQTPDPNSIVHENRLFTVFSKTAKEWYLSVHYSFSLWLSHSLHSALEGYPTPQCTVNLQGMYYLPILGGKKESQGNKHHFSLSFSSHRISAKTQFLLGSRRAWGLATESNTQ